MLLFSLELRSFRLFDTSGGSIRISSRGFSVERLRYMSKEWLRPSVDLLTGIDYYCRLAIRARSTGYREFKFIPRRDILNLNLNKSFS